MYNLVRQSYQLPVERIDIVILYLRQQFAQMLLGYQLLRRRLNR